MRTRSRTSKKGGSGHPFGRLPLLPSGPGGVHRLHVAQSHKSSTVWNGRHVPATLIGGERGIRTLGTSRYTRFPIVPLRPLGHLSGHRAVRPPLETAEREGFEPPVELPPHLISNQAPSTSRPPLPILLGGLRSRTR